MVAFRGFFIGGKMNELDARLIVSCFQYQGVSSHTKRLGVTKFLHRHVTDQVYRESLTTLLKSANNNIFYKHWLREVN